MGIMKRLKWLILALILVAAAVTLRMTVLAPKPVEVHVAPVTRGAVEDTVTNTRAGTVKVRRRAKLSPQLGGVVVELPHREGDSVPAGELLLRLDNRAQRAELELAERDVRAVAAEGDEACLAAELAEKELARVVSLHDSGIASDQDLDSLSTERDRSRAACAAARAMVERARARVAAARVQLEFTELRAPFAGTVAELTTEVGEWITPAPPGVPIPPIIDLLDAASTYVSAPIDEVDAERVRIGQEARVTVDSRPGEAFGARVVRVASYVLDDLEQNRTVEIEVEFSEPEQVRGVLAGTSADVEVVLDRRDGVLRVPAAAVAEGGSVLVLAGGVLEARTVEVGLRNWQVVQILAGLVEGEQVVTSRPSTEVKAGARAVALE
ncbi:MAG: efflux RND transporter periplasmic adaptor subunit [Holophagae bacterium]|nr:MAG: efflux RND transporter periplasmic adaptor subunit [Holophagae bacterium]